MTATFCSTTDVLDRVGANGDAGIIASGGWIERYINAAEQTICTETNIDYLTNYASAGTALQGTLKICAASHAAKSIINYNMKGYTTRAEAITMLNVNYEDFSRTLKVLKDVQANTLRSLS